MTKELEVNGEEKEITSSISLAELVNREVEGKKNHVAVAVGGEVIPRGEWPGTNLCGGEKIEIVQPIQGG